MRWLVDECVDAALVVNLRAAKHDVVYMAEIAPATSDADVMARAQMDGRLLLTEDKDFGDLVFRGGGAFQGLCCYVSIRQCTRSRAAASMRRFPGSATTCSAAT